MSKLSMGWQHAVLIGSLSLVGISQSFAKDADVQQQDLLNQKIQQINVLTQEYAALKEQLVAAQTTIGEIEKEQAECLKQNRAYRNPLSLSGMRDWRLVQKLQDSAIYGQDPKKTYLGVLDFYGKHRDSIFNPESPYGDVRNPNSVWNLNGYFGNPNSPASIHNPYSKSPPLLKKFGNEYGAITANAAYQDLKPVDPTWLRQVQPIVLEYSK
ncbi:hypothetical protein [Thiosulfativibrio zosterae]|uniref:Uncharacterized protein n=1 Tax=Thiosulfativibrio zosterae TaxID=2675053 RepID=A0A6F8PLN0_9GAMM|nr:hypothetical protein [Thiosulfativibrio zosterae]BBP42978.1 hypothetical protein THMIRHAT_07240 [Thiosulfativibrio zosterae]